jgi:hypothetical protein
MKKSAQMSKTLATKISMSLLIYGASMMPFVGVQAEQLDKRAILAQAGQAYYSLRGEGLESFQCDITPNWANQLKDASKQNPRNAAEAIKFLSQLRFTVTLAADGSVKFRHNEVASKDKSREAALRQIYGGMEQMTVGFFETWKLFVLTPPFPRATSDYQLESIGSQYKLSYREGEASVITMMGTDFAIIKVIVSTSQFDSSIEPKFAATPKGLILTAYEADYQSQKPEEATKTERARCLSAGQRLTNIAALEPVRHLRQLSLCDRTHFFQLSGDKKTARRQPRI